MTPAQEQLTALRQCGAQQLDPVHWHYLEVLAQRAQAQPPQVQRILERRLERLLAAFHQRLQHTPAQAQPEPVQSAKASALGALTRYLQQQLAAQEGPQANAEPAHGDAARPAHATPGMRTELKSVRQARNTWSRLSADKQLNQALNQAPRNAGPINSHRVVLRSLSLMRDASPDYFNRFVSYVDTLLCLDQSETDRPLAAKAAADEQAGKKPRVRRTRNAG